MFPASSAHMYSTGVVPSWNSFEGGSLERTLPVPESSEHDGAGRAIETFVPPGLVHSVTFVKTSHSGGVMSENHFKNVELYKTQWSSSRRTEYNKVIFSADAQTVMTYKQSYNFCWKVKYFVIIIFNMITINCLYDIKTGPVYLFSKADSWLMIHLYPAPFHQLLLKSDA